ncbi:Gfo/Idh/MocA family oxidoreductase [Kitasatospora sp. MAP5-34]|uniref:Gfo/Idh/MocA family protein n=1 Tax=Kitasatospora sp. MAP5-34 TaxID=3035102 RepID=UPI002473E7A1|nr:Gfo/Idh/MocA family oxidoreductase [Kitasatospora sp. MAP5-34]MDH6578645.1 myo-inositol 2-dehydrogenase/D-chiro-inositol 1-dehydrogenase [Kitasatospora sp. MAP5-34]
MTLRIGFVGTGYIAKEHLKRVAPLPNVEVAALCDIDSGATAVAAALASALGHTPVVYQSVQEMFDQQDLSAVFICLPPHAHGAAELAAIEARVPMFVEKPLSVDLAQAIRINGLLDAAGVIAATGYQTRYSAIIDHIQQVLDGRRIAMAVSHRYTSWPKAPWYADIAKSGGQVLEMATHQVDMLRYLMGEIDTVYAVGRRRSADSPDTEILAAEAACFSFADGAIGSLTNNLISGHGKPQRAKGLHLFADDVTISVLGFEGEARTVQVIAGGEVTETVFDDDSMAKQDVAFLRAVEEKDPGLIRSPYADALRTLAVTAAHRESARTGAPIRVADLLSGETRRGGEES